MPTETRHQALKDNDPYLTSEDQDIHVKVYQELKYIEQQVKCIEEYNPNVLRTLITDVFEIIKTKNKNMEELSNNTKALEEKIIEMNEEKNYLQDKINNQNQQISDLIQENQTILDQDYQIIVEKNAEITTLRNIIEKKKAENGSQNTDLIKVQDITIKNHEKQLSCLKLLIQERENTIKKQKLEIEGLNLTIKSMEGTIDQINNKQLNYFSTTTFNSSFDVSKTIENNTGITAYDNGFSFTTPHSNRPLRESGNIRKTPRTNHSSTESLLTNKSPKKTEKSEHQQLKDHLNQIDDNINSKFTDMDKNIKIILEKIKQLEQSKSKTKDNEINPAQQSKPISPPIEIQEKVDVLLIGDHHANQLKSTLIKYIPKNWSIKEKIVDDADFPKLSTTKDSTACTHLIIMAGTHDIQKTPMYEIKEAIDKIIKTYKSTYTHFIQIPERYDDLNLNYHINRVNKSLQSHLSKYQNKREITIYKTKEIINSWDFNEKTKINQNGMNKLCYVIRQKIEERYPNEHQSTTYFTHNDRYNDRGQHKKVSWKNSQQPVTSWKNSQHPVTSWKNSQHPVTSALSHNQDSMSYNAHQYEVDFPVYNQRSTLHNNKPSQQIIRPFTKNKQSQQIIRPFTKNKPSQQIIRPFH
ncbi:hypothetical protein M8J75_002566 [Diaphorina citri]|nr:hypothetical protein M8J75_002566 [Diaphorina citri]